MPIQAGIPVLEPPVVVPVYPFAESRTLAFRSLDGIDLMPWTGGEFFLLGGMRGLDMPPVVNVVEQLPGMAGARLREIQVGIREVFLPLFYVSNTSHTDFLAKKRAVSAMLSHLGKDYVAHDGSFDLVATSGTDMPTTRALRCYYVSGNEGTYTSSESSPHWASIGITLNAARPYWVGDPWSTEVLRLPTAAAWFPGFPGQLSASRVLGAGLGITVDGQVPSWPTVDVTGPATSVTVTAPGLSVTIPAGVAAGEAVHIATDPRGRTATFNGVKGWARIGPADIYAPLAPGDQQITVVVPGATSQTSARVYGDTQYVEWC